MGGIKLQKRKDDFFVSYGHGDLVRVAPLVGLLKRVCGLGIWFDSADGNAATRSTDLLTNAIQNARGSLFCLSEAWKRSSWCKDEYEVSKSEQRAHDGFEIVALRLDDVDPPPWFTVAEIVDHRKSNAQSVARLLCSLTSEVPRRYDNDEDIYLAAPWSRPSEVARAAFSALGRTGWRLVGDNPNLKHMGAQRVEGIIRTTRGVVALLPHDASQPEGATSPYILEEARLAIKCGKPLLVLAEPGVAPPEDVVRGAFRSRVVPLTETSEGRTLLGELLEDFDEQLDHEGLDDSGAFIFLASSLRDDPSEADDVTSVIERSSNMRCVRGERLSGDNVQTEIIKLIRRSAVVIADVSDDHRNSLIEAGIAMGCGTKLKLMAREPPEGGPLKKRFMFEGQEFYWYKTPEERLGLCCYFARQFRRRVYVTR
jgi:hypothetical protein